MEQKLLADIELDVQELKCLMKSFEQEPNPTLTELLKRNILQMQGRLDQLLESLNSVQKTSAAEGVKEPVVIKETPLADLTEEVLPPAKECPAVVEEPEPTDMPQEEAGGERDGLPMNEATDTSFSVEVEVRSSVLGENIRVSSGLRQSISLNDSFRFSRELFKGNVELMNRIVEQISVMSSYKAAVAFLSSKSETDEENEAYVDFLELLKKYFNQPA